ncbi:MAG: hypothetical protein HY558_06860 [Euryarchaeota archaeon]|nr:hypothetical protein [Euryarchaeota archaeon]
MKAKGSFNERANFLAQEYWNIKERTHPAANEKTRLEEIERLLAKGISGKLGAQLEKEATELRRLINDKRTSAQTAGAIRQDLLELVSEFAPSLDLRQGSHFPYDREREPLTEPYFRAITDILLGTPKTALEFHRATLSANGIQVPGAEDDHAALGALNYVTLLLQEAAKKMLGRENYLDKSWNHLNQREYAMTLLGVLVQAGRPLTIEEIRTICNTTDQEYRQLVTESYDKGLAQDLAHMVSNAWQYPPIEKQGSRYGVTDFGLWMWHFCKEMGDRAPPEDPDKSPRIGKLFSRKK